MQADCTPNCGSRNRCALAEVDLFDGGPRPLDEELAHLVAAELLQIAIAEAQVPARVDQLRQRLPVPFGRLFFRRQVFFQGFQHLALGHALGPFAGEDLGRLEIHAAKVAGVELHRQLLGRPARKRLAAVVLVEELVEEVVDLLLDHLQDQLLAVGAVENVLAVAVNAFALLIHHLVVFEEVFADLEVPFLDLLLAPSMRRETMRLSMASPSLMPSRVSTFLTHSPAKIRIRSSSSER